MDKNDDRDRSEERKKLFEKAQEQVKDAKEKLKEKKCDCDCGKHRK